MSCVEKLQCYSLRKIYHLGPPAELHHGKLSPWDFEPWDFHNTNGDHCAAQKTTWENETFRH